MQLLNTALLILILILQAGWMVYHQQQQWGEIEFVRKEMLRLADQQVSMSYGLLKHQAEAEPILHSIKEMTDACKQRKP